MASLSELESRLSSPTNTVVTVSVYYDFQLEEETPGEAPSHRKYAARSRSFRVIANHLISQLMIVGGLEVPVNKPLPGQPVSGSWFYTQKLFNPPLRAAPPRLISTAGSPSNYSPPSRNPTEGKDRESPLDPVSSRQDVQWFEF